MRLFGKNRVKEMYIYENRQVYAYSKAGVPVYKDQDVRETVRIDYDFASVYHCAEINQLYEALERKYNRETITTFADGQNTINTLNLGLLIEDTEGKQLYDHPNELHSRRKLRRTNSLTNDFRIDLGGIKQFQGQIREHARHRPEYEKLRNSRLYSGLRSAFERFLFDGVVFDGLRFTYENAIQFKISNDNCFEIETFNGEKWRQDGGSYVDYSATIYRGGNRALTHFELAAFSCLLSDEMPDYFGNNIRSVLVDNNGLYLRSYIYPYVIYNPIKTEPIPDDGIY